MDISDLVLAVIGITRYAVNRIADCGIRGMQAVKAVVFICENSIVCDVFYTGKVAVAIVRITVSCNSIMLLPRLKAIYSDCGYADARCYNNSCNPNALFEFLFND